MFICDLQFLGIAQKVIAGDATYFETCYTTFRNFIKGVNEDFIDGLRREYTMYAVAVRAEQHLFTITKSMSLWEWWKTKKDVLVWHWRLVKKAALFQPSSAAAERVFSVIAGAINKRQATMLSDRYAVIGRLRYNSQYVPPTVEKELARQLALQRKQLRRT